MKGFKRVPKERGEKPGKAVEKEEKAASVRTNKVHIAGRVLLWSLIGILLVRGIFSIFMPGSEVQVSQLIHDFETENRLRLAQQISAAAYAEGFAMEYYTFTGRTNSGFGSRIQPYAAKGLEIREPSAGQVEARALSAKAQEITYLTGAEMDVDVHLVVEYTELQTEAPAAVRKDVYLRVPLAYDEGGYAVVSLPSHIPEMKKTDMAAVSYSGQSVTQAEAQQIKATLNSFFAVYFGGSANEVSYYLTADSDIDSGVNSEIEFSRIENTGIYTLGDGYQADVVLSVSDLGQPMQQRVFMELIKQGDKYYVKSLNTRPVVN